MKNIHVLPTDKDSKLYLGNLGKPVTIQSASAQFKEPLHIYITSDEEIKDVRPHKGKWQLEQGQILNKFPTYLTDLSECKLVIMTTDQDLIKDGVQAIDDDFLEWFVKNPSCDKVRVGTEIWNDGRWNYFLPKEEPKQEKMYSEEEVKFFLNAIISEIGLRKENIEKNQDKMPIHLLEGGLIAFESSIDVIKESFEEFKKK